MLSFARRSFISNQTCLKFVRLDLPQWGLTTTSLPVTANAMHAHAVDSHPPSTSSTLRATEYVLVRGLGAYPANTEVARTIASLRGMYGIDPPGRAIAVSAPNTCGVSCMCLGLFMWARYNFALELNREIILFAVCVMCFRVVRQFRCV